MPAHNVEPAAVVGDPLLARRFLMLRFELYGADPKLTHVWRKPGSEHDFAELNGFCAAWAALCNLPENLALVPLRRCEGGLATPGNEEKHVRLNVNSEGDILGLARGPGWTLAELLDLKDAFKVFMDARLTQQYDNLPAATRPEVPPKTNATLEIV